MKKIFATIASVVLTSCLFAQAPQKMSYQAVVRDSNDKLVTNQVVGMQVSILKDSPTEGTVVYTETQTAETNINGLVSINIGGKEGFEDINWAKGNYYIKTEIDLKGSTNYTITGTYQILSVPYAFHAAAAKTAIDAVNLTGDQTIAGNKTFTGTAAVPTPVNKTDAATKAYVDALEEKLKPFILIVSPDDSITDSDGNTYNTIRIGTQVWMGKNLKTTKFKNGTDISYVPGGSKGNIWMTLTTPCYCWYNDSLAFKHTSYGALYNWFAVSTGYLCPTDWHVPTIEEYTTLITYLGGEGVAGGKLKETGSAHWGYPNLGATNQSNFTALPGGQRVDEIHPYMLMRGQAFWWLASEFDNLYAWFFDLSTVNFTVGRNNSLKPFGLSVRCIRDY